jgi:hypothetical protein
MSVRPFVGLHLTFFETVSRKLQFLYILTRITGTVHEDQYTFLIMARSVLLRVRNVSGNSCRENESTHFVLSDFFFSENRAVCEIMRKNI